MAEILREGDPPVRLEWLILVDAAEVVNGKLYVLGGGWDRLTITSDFPVTHPSAMAVSFEVSWNETNAPNVYEIVVTDEDSQGEVARVDGHFEVGRPVGIPAGQSQRFQFATNFLLPFERPGVYEVIVRVAGEDVGRTHFQVIAG
jgi:hypothetical protein